ncbi:AAA family ATPase, partial [Rhodococcus zopfii]
MTTPDTTTASLYQRLRGHLATLKLHDAAEALPSVLDRAQKQGLSMTATLEQLLSIEVDATDPSCTRLVCQPRPGIRDAEGVEDVHGVVGERI